MMHKSAEKVEAYLREHGVPYVAVDEAKRALFGDVRIGSFDFVIYRAEGPNLLAFAGGITARRKKVLRQWEEVFGREFIGAFVQPNADGDHRRPSTITVRYLGLDGRELEGPPPPPAEREPGWLETSWFKSEQPAVQRGLFG